MDGRVSIRRSIGQLVWFRLALVLVPAAGILASDRPELARLAERILEEIDADVAGVLQGYDVQERTTHHDAALV